MDAACCHLSQYKPYILTFYYFFLDRIYQLGYGLVQVHIQIAIHSINPCFKGFNMNAGEILQQVDGLTNDKLTYFVRAGYLQPNKIKRGSLNYNDFSETDLELVRIAWDFIMTYGTKTSIAFQKAKAEVEDPQMRLL